MSDELYKQMAQSVIDGDDDEACRTLGWMKISGLGAPKDKKGGRLIYEKACDRGDVPSCAMAGDLNYAKRDRRARRYLERACELEHMDSCANLGWMLAHGEGDDADLPGALRLYQRACAAGESGACVLAGLHQRDHLEDRAAARRSFARACELGDRLACGNAASEAQR